MRRFSKAIPSINKQVVEENFRLLTTGLDYEKEEHSVFTDDGYRLHLFRINAKRRQNDTTPRRSVWLQHGLLHSSDTWIMNQEKKALGFFLANRGFDVWLGNNRGNKYGREHESLSVKSSSFWDFSFQEMGKRDLPAILKKILEVTGKDKVSYVGHSQGNTQMFASMCSDHSSDIVNKHIDVFVALSPVVYLANQSDESLRRSCKLNFGQVARTFGIYQILPGGTGSLFHRLSDTYKAFSRSYPNFTDNIMSALTGGKPEIDDFQRLGTFFKHQPSGTSLRTLEHFQQMILQDPNEPKFQEFDFGILRNKKEYGTPTPPEYDLDRIRVPIRSLVPGQDRLSEFKDNQILAYNLKVKRNKDYEMFPFFNCGHMTYMWGKDPEELFLTILRMLDAK